MKNEINEKWLQETTTISREEMGELVAAEVAQVLAVVDMVFGDESAGMSDLFKELLATFSASVCAKMFLRNKKNEEQEDK